LNDAGKTLIVHTVGKEESGLTVEQAVCILGMLGTPSAILAQMDSTRALDGRQEGSWAGFKASWTYHPDAGLDMIIEEQG
jgi:hypothetical protein